MTIESIVRDAHVMQALAGYGVNQGKKLSGQMSVKGRIRSGLYEPVQEGVPFKALGSDVSSLLHPYGFPNLSHADLRDMTLDGVRIVGANFSGADLRGVNFAEATLIGCDFSDADLVDVCCADAVFENCNFSYARFGVTDITGAIFRHCRFAGAGALILPWGVVSACEDVVYICATGQPLSIDQAPFLLGGGDSFLTFIDGILLYRDEPVAFHSVLLKKLSVALQQFFDLVQNNYIMKI